MKEKDFNKKQPMTELSLKWKFFIVFLVVAAGMAGHFLIRYHEPDDLLRLRIINLAFAIIVTIAFLYENHVHNKKMDKREIKDYRSLIYDSAPKYEGLTWKQSADMWLILVFSIFTMSFSTNPFHHYSFFRIAILNITTGVAFALLLLFLDLRRKKKTNKREGK